MIDVRTIQFVGGPNIQAWPPTAKITSSRRKGNNVSGARMSGAMVIRIAVAPIP